MSQGLPPQRQKTEKSCSSGIRTPDLPDGRPVVLTTRLQLLVVNG
eukprot:CAMPEP_0204301556 /NCGR_PEP_ID=MMETSP0468-20130131/80619_1 /ASSEMBLY_ACC=CAM_ASM_000383 /TAXON_ID=2969 /ORGANISM="Oxyrrhis marina" /LENGTH=44 /DNA_ID= /DNA_START= /DNA_END= /DNA_ORIENTATION=